MEYIYQTDYGEVKVEEYFPPYSIELMHKVAKFADENTRDKYRDNYSMGNELGSLGNLLRNNGLVSVYIGYLDNEFQFFLSTRIAEDTKMFLVLVRTFSKLEKIKKPIHTSYILKLQMELAKKMGYEECSFCMNVGVRDGLAELVKKRYLHYNHEPNMIKALALENMSKFEYKGIQTVNYCEQHVFTAKL